MQHDNFDEEDSLHRIEQGDEIAAGFARPSAPWVDPATTADFELAGVLVTELIARLCPEERLVISLLHLEAKSVDEIHALTGWSRSATKVRAFRARAQMKK